MHGVDLGSEVSKALGYLIAAAAVIFVYDIGKRGMGTENYSLFGSKERIYNEHETKRDVYKRLWQGFLSMTIAAWVIAILVSQNSNGSTDDSEVLKHTIFFGTLFIIPFLMGINAKFEEINMRDKKDKLQKKTD